MYLTKMETSLLYIYLAVNTVILKEITTSSQLPLNIIHRVMVTSVMFHRTEEMTYSLIRTLENLMLKHSLA